MKQAQDGPATNHEQEARRRSFFNEHDPLHEEYETAREKRTIMVVKTG